MDVIIVVTVVGSDSESDGSKIVAESVLRSVPMSARG